MVPLTNNLPDESHESKPRERSDRAVREIDSRELLQGQHEIVIRHGDEAYRLSLTRSGKLLLRK